jgi:glycosyltransferase involved in cell wall biosynthesis
MLSRLAGRVRRRKPLVFAPPQPRRADADARSVLFFRTFQKFHGGHLKVWDYYNHVLSDPSFIPFIRFARSTTWDAANPWSALALEEADRPPEPDVVFLAGRDWTSVPERDREDPPVPVVNLIQHVRHADEGHPLSEFLGYKAIRICVSPEVAEQIRATGRANGPVLTIANGIDVAGVVERHPPRERTLDLLIVANKRPELGRELAASLGSGDRKVALIDSLVPREDFLGRLREAQVTLFLPNLEEGFYLPAIEGMALGTTVVCPDVVGNRSFCVPGETAYRPAYTGADIVAATEQALAAVPDVWSALREAGARMAAYHDVARERREFLEVLHDVDRLWST